MIGASVAASSRSNLRIPTALLPANSDPKKLMKVSMYSSLKNPVINDLIKFASATWVCPSPSSDSVCYLSVVATNMSMDLRIVHASELPID